MGEGAPLADGPVGFPYGTVPGALRLSSFQDVESSLGKQMFIYFVPLGFDLCEVGQEEVILKTGKQANRRTMHFALQSLLALFGMCSARHRSPCAPWGRTPAQTFWGKSGDFVYVLETVQEQQTKLPALVEVTIKIHEVHG